MRISEFLKISIERNWAYNINWVRAVLGVLLENNAPNYKAAPGMPFATATGCFVDIDGELVKLDGYRAKEPLLTCGTMVVVDPSWLPLIKDAMEIKVGVLLANYYLVWKPFKGKIELQLPVVSESKLDEIACQRMVRKTDKPVSPTEIYPEEFVYYQKVADWMRQFASIISVSASERVITEPDGIREAKRKLVEKYKGQLSDPVKLVEFQAELGVIEAAWLKGDPGELFAKHSKVSKSRAKLFLTAGHQMGFENKATTNLVIESLSEGWPRDPESFAILMNDARAGSFSRGSETIDGGVAAKKQLRALNNYVVVDGDCGSKLYHRRFMGKHNINTLVGRTVIMDNGTQKLIENSGDLANYLGKWVKMRSPRACKTIGQRLCRRCSGERLFRLPKGLTIPATEVSAEILTSSLKAMHGTKLETVTIDLNLVLS